MTFDDGIIKIYFVTNSAPAGAKPVRALVFQEAFHFGYDTLGINRYYIAKQAHEKIEAVINIPGWQRIPVESVAIDEEDAQFIVRMVQPQTDEDGLRITKLSLERLTENYAISS